MKKYSEEFKKEAVRLALEGGMSHARVARDLGVNVNSLAGWIAAACMQASEYQKLLSDYGMQVSMSGKGDCWENAPMESFFHKLKTELTHHNKYRTREEARRDIFKYIEVFYNRQRIHSSLGYKSPPEFESEFQVFAHAA